MVSAVDLKTQHRQEDADALQRFEEKVAIWRDEAQAFYDRYYGTPGFWDVWWEVKHLGENCENE